MKRKSKNILPVGVLLLLCGFLTACNGDVPTYEIQVSGTVVDSKGGPVVGADIKIMDNQYIRGGGYGNTPIARLVGKATTDEKGHYALSAYTEGRSFSIKVSLRVQNWDKQVWQSGEKYCKFVSGMSEYVVDMVAKTANEYYTGDAWKDAIEAAPLEIGLSDSIQIRLKNEGTLLCAGICFDNPYSGKQNEVRYHNFQSDLGLLYSVYGGTNNKMQYGLTEYNLVFHMDTINNTIKISSKLPYCACCHLRVHSVKENHDEDEYFIPLTISDKSK